MGEMKGVDAYRENAKPEEERKYLYLRWGWGRFFVSFVMLGFALGAFYRFGKMAEQREERQGPPACQDEAILINSGVWNLTEHCSDKRAHAELRPTTDSRTNFLVCTCPKVEAPMPSPPPAVVDITGPTKWSQMQTICKPQTVWKDADNNWSCVPK